MSPCPGRGGSGARAIHPLCGRGMYSSDARGRRCEREARPGEVPSPYRWTCQEGVLTAGTGKMCPLRLSDVADSRGRNHTAYYRERPGLSGSHCTYGAWSVPASIVDEQMHFVFSRLKLRQDWKSRVVDRLSSESERRRVISERQKLEERLRRLTETYIDGNVEKRCLSR